MDSIRHFNLGERFPNSPHAVISCLPTMTDVRGYEEHKPRVVNALKSGYPRFVVHEFVQKLMDFYCEREALAGRYSRIVIGRRAADDLLAWLGGAFAKLKVEDDLYLVHCDAADEKRCHDLKKYVQHTGCGVSSRQAEDLLLGYGLMESRFPEESYSGRALSRAEGDLADLIGCRRDDVLICASGMNAFYSAFRSVQEYQRSRGRGAWVQLGWVYLDSGKILGQFLGEGETLDCVYDVYDVDLLLHRIRSLGDSLAAVFVECPSNPLVSVCDLKRIAEAVREQGGVMVVDPTIASIYNVDVLPYTDILVTSLTKYASIEGDVMIGALALNANSSHYGGLVLRTSSFYVPPYPRDLQRLIESMKEAPQVIERMNTNAAKLCAFLRGHPAVRRVFYPGSSGNIQGVSRGDGPVGAVISIELVGELERFYDRIKLMKGPSFGARYTLLCPFMYLAHYDLVTSEEGREFLSRVGIHPELVRISVGEEPYEEIESVFADALNECE